LNKFSTPQRLTLTAMAISSLLIALPGAANAVEIAQPQGPVANTVMTPGYARAVAQMAYVWGWPMVNLQTRRMMYEQVPTPGLLGPTPVAPVNQLAMLSDYINPGIRIVAHPNQDVVYGFGALALDKGPVILQVPDFGDRFWMYELADQRTDSFAQVAKIYATKPGFYLIVGPDWKGEKRSGAAFANQHRRGHPARVHGRHRRGSRGDSTGAQSNRHVPVVSVRRQGQNHRLEKPAETAAAQSHGGSTTRRDQMGHTTALLRSA
jgi:hypothetical protein